jgi:hypothetical protein
MKRRPKIGLLGWAFRVSLMIVPALFVCGVVRSQALGEGGEYGITVLGGGTIAGPLTISSTLQATNLGLGLAPDATRLHMLSEAADTTPTEFTANDLVVGRSALTDVNSGAIFMRYDSTGSKAFLGALSPGVAWRPLVVGASQTTLQNASGVAKAVLPGTGTNNLTLSSTGLLAFSSTTAADGSADTAIIRNAAGVVKFTDASTGTGQILGRLINSVGAVATEPIACAAGTLGTVTVINDTNDGAVTHVCYCGQQANDTTYDWLKITDNSACAEF